MKPVQIGAFVVALLLSSLAMAEGGGDRTFDRMMTNNDRSMELFVAKEKARDPVVVNDRKAEQPPRPVSEPPVNEPVIAHRWWAFL